jgi:hypothetical protein
MISSILYFPVRESSMPAGGYALMSALKNSALS